MLINPQITQAEGEQVVEKGCLSFSGYFAKIKRIQWIRFSAFDADGSRRIVRSLRSTRNRPSQWQTIYRPPVETETKSRSGDSSESPLETKTVRFWDKPDN